MSRFRKFVKHIVKQFCHCSHSQRLRFLQDEPMIIQKNQR
ncbi:hypothetical protein BIFDEN_01028 [Bifidobacterium dentium ATCC 27678]|nr:hypothetical protein BIFDEN_01028 [Bifidobacterium dentium ATCC 27678]